MRTALNSSFICHAYDCLKSDVENESCEATDVFIDASGECTSYNPVRSNEQVDAIMKKYGKT